MVDVLAAPQQAKTDSALRTLTGISVAHWLSHFHMLVLPMLFPFLKERLGVGYVELGVALTVFGVVSAVIQAPLGYLVDHAGARKILLLGLCIGGMGLILLGIHLSYANLIICGVLLGIANGVYHPADYAILSAHTDEARMGRAFGIHTFAGYLGFAVAPALVAALVTVGGGQAALIACGALGPLIALLLIVLAVPDARAQREDSGEYKSQGGVITPALMVLTAFFTLLGLSTAGISNFGVVALMGGYGATFSIANMALTAYLGASAVGVLVGGYLADHTQRHGQVAAACFAANGIIVAVVAYVTLPAITLVATMTLGGFLSGMIAPSRDMLVRNAAPADAAGRAFGIVSTGFNFAAMASPLLFGWIMDQNMPHWVFGLSAAFMIVTVVLTPFTEPRKAKAPQP
jgi:MFS family permease